MISQMALLARARWQILRNSLGRTGGWADLAAQIVLVVIVGAAAVMFGAMLGFGAYRMTVRPDRIASLQILFWVVFGLWQLMPMMGEAASPGLNFRDLARYPLPFRTFFTLHTLYGLVDPMAMIAMVWLGFIAGGNLLARPAWKAPWLVVGPAFLLTNLMLQRVLFDLLERLTATRRGRERFLAAMVAVSVFGQMAFFSLAGGAESSRLAMVKSWLAPVSLFFPPVALYRGLSGEMLTPTLVLLGEALLFGLLLWPLLWRKYLGEVVAETAAPRAAVQVEPGWQLPVLSPVLSAMVEKEVRYLLGQSQMALGFLMVPMVALVTALGSQIQKFLATAFRVNADSIYPGLAGFLVLSTSSWAYNSFGFESYGFDRWVLAPVRFREVILAKNLMLATVVLGNFALITAIFSVSPGLAAVRVVTVAVIVIFALTMGISIGNFFAVWSPSAMDYQGMRTRKVSELGVLGAVCSQFVILGMLAGLFYAVARWKLAWLPQTGLLLLLDAVAFGFYFFSLHYAARYATARHDVMASRLY